MDIRLFVRMWTVAIGIAAVSTATTTGAETPLKTVALLADRPVSGGWHALGETEAFRYAAGRILQESLAATPGVALLPWKDTSGIRGVVDSGLYFFQADKPHARWSELLTADAFVLLDVTEAALTYAVHTPEASKEDRVDKPFQQPKQAIARFVRQVYATMRIEPPPVVDARLKDPETKTAGLFMLWAAWDNFKPSPYAMDENPWRRPSAAAGTIIKGDPAFMRGLSWALPMVLKPVDVRGKPGQRRPFNPSLFDLNVLRVLDSRFAERILPHYKARLQEDKRLFESSVDMLKVEGETLDLELGEDGGGEGPSLEGPAVAAAFRDVKSTPRIRRNVCLALSGIEHGKLVERIAMLIEDDPDAGVREAAATSLGGFKKQPAILKALRQAAQDKSAQVRLAAFRSLARLGAVASAAFEAGRKDADADVRRYVQSTRIDKLADKEAARRLVLETLAGDDPALRQLALARATALFDAIAPIAPAAEQALKSGEPGEQRAALRAVERFRAAALAEHLPSLLSHPAADIRALAAELLCSFQPGRLGEIVKALAEDPAAAVQLALIRCIAASGRKEHLSRVQALLASPHPAARQAASDAMYRLCRDDRIQIVWGMLADASMRVNHAALRAIRREKLAPLIQELPDVVARHPNEYVRAQALVTLDHMDDPRVHDAAIAALRSPYFIVRLFGAGILCRRAVPRDAAPLEQALAQTRHPWLKLPLEDALARSRKQPPPERVRLGLGEREHTEGGEFANGIQLWLGNLSEDDAENRRLVDAGYRFGKVLPAPKERRMWSMRTWNNSKGERNTYLLHVLATISELDARFLHYYCLFDEPHVTGGADADDVRHAFLLEINRPDLIGTEDLPAEYREHRRTFFSLTLTELSNWVMRVLRNTLQRKYQDLQLFPQTLTYMRGAAARTWHRLDADGDYSWRYDYHNLLGHYGKGAVMRALKPGLPTTMVTRIGTYKPRFFHLDEVYTNTKFRPGPWILRNHLATRAGLALYASGAEVGYFNSVAFKSRAQRGLGTGGRETYQLTPWSEELTAVIDKMIAGDQKLHWDKVRLQIELEVMKEHGKGAEAGKDERLLAEDGGAEGDADLLDLEDTKGKIEKEVEKRYQEAVRKEFENAMIGISWMNIFNADNSRAMSNLPKPDRSPRSTLVVLARGSGFDRDGPAFPMPAMALAAGFDLVPFHQCLAAVDLDRYDTLLLEGADAGVTGALVAKINDWLQTREGLLIVNGGLRADEAFLPELLADPPEDRFLWEDDVRCTRVARVTVEEKDRKGKVRRVDVHAPLERVTAHGTEQLDDTTRWRCHYTGKLQAFAIRGKQNILARWQAPAAIKAVVLFDGAADAGPVYTGMLEKVVLALDQERGAKVRRNRWWGHVGVENDRFVIDVATSGYRKLQAARPRQHEGIDIIYGVIDPEVRHASSTLILKDYVGPYAGGKGDWAVMARSELIRMELASPERLALTTRGVVRVTHKGERPIRLADAKGFSAVESQLDVWKAMWDEQRAWCRREIDGGWELHYQSPDPVVILAE